MFTAFSPQQIANYFIKKNFETGLGLTPMKLLKLCYMAHGWHLGMTKQPLLSELIQAWKYGPVVASIYREFKDYKDGEITSLAMATDSNFNKYYPMPNNRNVELLLDKIWEVYGSFDGVYLSTLTHESGTPWDIVWNQQGGNKRESAIIPNDLIMQYYEGQIKGTHAANNVE